MTTTPPGVVAEMVRPYSARFLDVLRVFDPCRGHVTVEAATLSGIGRSTLHLSPPTRAIPLALLDAIRDGDGLRFQPATRGGGNTPLDLGAAFVLWRPAPRFDAATGWRHRVPDAEQATIAAALAAFPMPPAVLIDAGPEVVGLWPLVAPLAVDQDPARAIALLVGLALQLGADVQVAQGLLDLTLPLAGRVRNWNIRDPEDVEILDVEPTRRYAVDDLEAACARAVEIAAPRKKGVRT